MIVINKVASATTSKKQQIEKYASLHHQPSPPNKKFVVNYDQNCYGNKTDMFIEI